jgi:hypothetical protein
MSSLGLRGRGCLEVRPCDNPFFQPVSTDLGKTSKDVPDWKVEGHVPIFNSCTQHQAENFQFLYTRESDSIGSRVKKPEIKGMLSRAEFLKQRREKMLKEVSEEQNQQQSSLFDSKTGRLTVVAENVLKIYKHEPKYEDPRYITSSVSTMACTLFYIVALTVSFYLV